MSKFVEECWFKAEEWANARTAERNYNTRAGAQLEIDESVKLGKLFEELEQLRKGEKAADSEIERLRAELVLVQDQEKRAADAAADCFKRLERCHDEADKYQARALKAEAENAELREMYRNTERDLQTQNRATEAFERQAEEAERQNAELRGGIADLLKQRWCEYLNKPHKCSDPDDDGRPVDEDDYCFVCKLRLLVEPKPGAGT